MGKKTKNKKWRFNSYYTYEYFFGKNNMYNNNFEHDKVSIGYEEIFMPLVNKCQTGNSKKRKRNM